MGVLFESTGVLGAEASGVTAAFSDTAEVAADMEWTVDLSIRLAAPGVLPAAISFARCAWMSSHLRCFSSFCTAKKM